MSLMPLPYTAAMRCARVLLGALGVWAALCSPVIGQTTKPASAPTDDTPLPQRQQAIRDRIQRLESRMLQLSQLLVESEPDKAERLRDALERTGERQVNRRIEQLVALLRSEKLSDADREQTKLLSDLEEILTLLTTATDDAERRRAERERLEAHKRAIQALMQDQTEQHQQTQLAQTSAERAAALGKLAEQLEKTEAEQKQLREQPKSGDAPAEKQQAALAERVRAAEGEIRAKGKGDEQSPAQPELEPAAEDAAAAAEAMQQAADKLQSAGGAEAQAQEAQQKAEERLARAIRRLREEQEKARQQSAVEELARRQRQTQQKADDVARQMQPQSEREPGAPGGGNVQQAAQNMQRAADRLGEQQPGGAKQEQEQALEQLQEALDELDDALRQIRREEMVETLAALEARFKSMLTREESVREAVIALHNKGAPAWNRTDQLQLGEAAQTQHAVADDCAAVLRLLTDEGTTVILPDLVRQLAADMTQVAAALDQADVSNGTQAALTAIIDALKEIVAAVEQQRNEQESNEGGEGGEGGNGDSNPPLLPGSAELKLLKAAQIRVNDRTAALGAALQGPPDAPTVQQFERLGQRQRSLSDLARRMYERK